MSTVKGPPLQGASAPAGASATFHHQAGRITVNVCPGRGSYRSRGVSRGGGGEQLASPGLLEACSFLGATSDTFSRSLRPDRASTRNRPSTPSPLAHRCSSPKYRESGTPKYRHSLKPK